MIQQIMLNRYEQKTPHEFMVGRAFLASLPTRADVGAVDLVGLTWTITDCYQLYLANSERRCNVIE